MYNFMIIGGGIIGMSTAMQSIGVYPGTRIALPEKEPGPTCHQMGHNSGVIHAGVYCTPGDLKAQFCLAGDRTAKTFCDQNSTRYDVCEKMLVTTSALEMERIHVLWDCTTANSPERKWLNTQGLRECEPNITRLGGIFIPSSGTVSYCEVTVTMAEVLQTKGGETIYNAKVSALKEHATDVIVRTRRGREYGDATLVGCSGPMAGQLIKMSDAEPDFTICSFRSEYFHLVPEYSQMVNHLIYPTPDPTMSLPDVHLTRVIDGSVTVDLGAVLAFKRESYRKRDFSLSDTPEILGLSDIRHVLQDNLRSGLGKVRDLLCKDGYLRLVQKYYPSLALRDL